MVDKINPKYTRVTEILSPFSGLQNIDPYILENAARRGTRVHKACEAIIEGLTDFPRDEQIKGYVESFEKWWATGHTSLAVERRFYCDNLMITGAIDIILQGPQDTAIIVDLKTSAQPSKTWPLQGAAYAHMAKTAGFRVHAIQFIQLMKDGSQPKIHEYEDNMGLFRAALDIYNHFYKPKTRKSK